MPTEFENKVYNACSMIPKGRISTYKEIGKFIGCRSYQAIGQALKKNPYAPIVPCHRVVSSDATIGGFKGKLFGPEIQEKIDILKKEGIIVKKGNIVDFKKKLFRF